MAVSKRVAEAMGGDLKVESVEGHGATFVFSVRVGKVLEKEPDAGEPCVFAGRTILLVEDNPVNQMVTRRMIEKLGCVIEVAPNRLDAVNLMTLEPPHVILMDCQMPLMHRFEATRKIRSHEGDGVHTPIIALTANATHEDRKHCMRAGMDDYPSKPVRIECLREMLESWRKTQP